MDAAFPPCFARILPKQQSQKKASKNDKKTDPDKFEKWPKQFLPKQAEEKQQNHS